MTKLKGKKTLQALNDPHTTIELSYGSNYDSVHSSGLLFQCMCELVDETEP